ncbi:MAG: PLDc N-terminal domain-containing protein [Actinomycetota bacterium]|nr:PLDc N-terminal domain-containing protein [Actinomycetota bacterium]
MLLSGALFALFLMGFWLYCLTDAVLTPAPEFRGLPKPAWVIIIIVTFIGGAIAWLIVRQPVRSSHAVPLPPPGDPGSRDEDAGFLSDRWTAADDAVARHPAGRARTTGAARAAPKGPDDDPDFLRVLDRVIRGNSQAGEEV